MPSLDGLSIALHIITYDNMGTRSYLAFLVFQRKFQGGFWFGSRHLLRQYPQNWIHHSERHQGQFRVSLLLGSPCWIHAYRPTVLLRRPFFTRFLSYSLIRHDKASEREGFETMGPESRGHWDVFPVFISHEICISQLVSCGIFLFFLFLTHVILHRGVSIGPLGQ